LNKGCALALLGEHEDADFWLKKGIKRCSTPKMSADFLVMQGISASMQGDKASAAKYLEQAKSIGSYLATINLDILLNKTPETGTLPEPDAVKGVEQIEFFALKEFLANPQVEKGITVAEGILCGTQQRPMSRIFLHYADDGKDYVVVQETMPNYRGATLRGITLKSSADNVQEAYGVPKHNINMPEGRVWVYPEAHIFFKFSSQLSLQSWGVYQMSGE
jgi:hypothetical protein